MDNKKFPLPSVMSYIVFTIAVTFYFFDFILQVMPGIFSKQLSISFSLDAEELGRFSAIYFLAYAVMQIPAGLLYDKFGGKRVLIFSTLVASIGTLMFSMSDNIIIGRISRVLMGGGTASAFLGALYFILRWFPERYFATLAGVVALVGSIGAMFGEVFLAYMLNTYNWRPTTLGLAVCGGFITVLIALFIKNHPYNDAEQTKLETKNNLRQELNYLLTHSQVWAIGIYCFLNWSVVTVFASLWGVPYLKRAYDMSLTDASWAVFLIWAGIGIGSPIIGWISDYMKRRKLILITCSILAITSLLIILYFANLPNYITYLALICLGISASGSTIVFATAKDIVQVESLNLCNGLINMLAVTSALVLQPLIGVIMNWLWIGKEVDNISVYTAMTYKSALFILVICAILSLLIGTFWIKEPSTESN